jgi:regulator-associated protein of mTOR
MKTTKHLEEDEDWQLPLAFNKSRHMVTIEGVNCITQTWRMKERVSLRLVLKLID